MTAAPAVQDPTSRAARLWRRTRFGGGLVLALVALLVATGMPESSAPVAGLGAVLAILLAFEAAAMGEFATWRLRAPLVAGALVASVASLVALERGGIDSGARALAAYGVVTSLAGLAALVVAAPVRAGREGEQRGTRLLLGVALSVWLFAPLPALGLVRAAFGHEALVALLVLSKIGDVAGYYGGSALGRHRPFPKLSPGKTTEGCVASALAGVVTGALLAASGVLPGTWLQGLVAGLVINVAAQAGDLFESWVKRRTKVKDSSTWLGPSGGLLDVVDSLLFTVPVALVAWPLILR